MSSSEYKLVADKITKALASRCPSRIAKLYADAVTVSHNRDQITQNKSQNIAALKIFFDGLESLELTQVRYDRLGDGLIQQHTIRGKMRDGRTLKMPACLVVRVQNGKVVKIDQYLDPAPFWYLLATAH